MIWMYIKILYGCSPIQLGTQVDNSYRKLFGGEDQQILWNYYITDLDIEFWIVYHVLGDGD